MFQTQPPDSSRNVVVFKPTRRRWLRRLIWLLIIVGGMYLARAQLLSAFAGGLVCDEHNQDGDVILVLGGDQCYRDAGELVERRVVDGVLLFERPPGRLERLGVLPSATDSARQELAKCGVSSEKIEAIRPESPEDQSVGRAIAVWLEQNSAGRLVITCDAFSSRALRWGLNRQLTKANAERVHIWPLTNRRYDERNWWRSKEGTSAFVRGWLGLVMPVIQTGPEPIWRECDPEVFESAKL